MKKYNYILLYSIGIITSCKSPYVKNLEAINQCSSYMISRFNKDTHLEKEVDFYKAMLDIEAIFIHHNLLSTTSKTSYKKLVMDIDAEVIPMTKLTSLQNELYQSIAKNKLDKILGDLPVLLEDCFEGVLYNHKNLQNTSISRQKEVMANAFTYNALNTYCPKEILYPLIETVDTIDFEENIVFRASVLLLVCDNIEALVHPSKSRLPINENKEVN